MSLILVVDDDIDIAKTVEINLVQGGYKVITANSGHEALQRAVHTPPDLVLLDIAMPEMDGIEVCHRLRANPITASVPILIMTVSKDIKSKTSGFSAGADDYLVKPFDLQELNLRVEALLRRGAHRSNQVPPQLAVGALALNSHTFELTVKDKKVTLTPVEFDLLSYMMRHANQVLSTEQLLRDVWDYPPGTGSPELVRAHVKNLRNKIEPNPKEPIYLTTVGRFGYTIRREES